MKIHYLVTTLEAGGAEFAIPDIVTTLQDLGHEVKIYVCEPRDMGAAPRLEAAGLSWCLLSNRRRSEPMLVAAYLAKTIHDKPDLIWTSLSWGTRIGQWVGRLMGIPVISFKHSASVKPATWRMRNMSRLWIGDSETVAQYLHETMLIPKQQVLCWPFFQANPQAAQAQNWDGKSVLQLGSVGRLHEVKNYAGLITALASFVDKNPQLRSRIRLTILGEGPEQEALQKTITQHALEDVVCLAGFSADVENFLAGLHVYIQTSRYEGMCLAAHEAMNAGLAIITTPVGELKESVIDGHTGYTLNGELTPALEGVLNRIFSEPEELERYGQNVRQYVLAKFSHENFVQSAINIVNRLIH